MSRPEHPPHPDDETRGRELHARLLADARAAIAGALDEEAAS